jgi:Bacterial protein of unknown function (DUF885)
MRVSIRTLLLSGLAPLCMCACAGKVEPPSPATSSAPQAAIAALTQPGVSTDWDALVTRTIEQHFAAHPVFAVRAGKHESDGRLPDWTRAGIAAEIARLKALREEARRFDEGGLDAERRYQREYLLARLDRDLFWLDKAGAPYRNPAFYFDWGLDSLDPSVYVTRTYAPPAQRLAALIRYLRNIPRAAAQIRDNLATPMPVPFVEYGIASFGGLADYYGRELVAAFADVDDAALLAAFAAARGPAIEAMQSLRTRLEQERDRATDDFALGPDLFRQMLYDTERVDIDLDRLEAIGRADLERNTHALAAACRRYAPGSDIRACFARMTADKPAGSPVEAARAQLGGLKAFVEHEDLVTIPSDDEARVAEAPPFARSNFAYISIPGPYEPNQPATYYISPPNPNWAPQVQHNYLPGKADLLFTSVHEVWPGHFLNFLHARQSRWIFGRLFVGYAYAEGWAHYGEEMMWDAGLDDGDPETHIGQLSNALLRDVRFLSAIGLHTKGMTIAESERLFREAGFQSEGTARQQAARGAYDPAYLNYTMGKLMIMQLREDWTRDRGGRAAWKDFHDAFLAYGGPPIPLVRSQMLGGPVEAVFWQPAPAQ